MVTGIYANALGIVMIQKLLVLNGWQLTIFNTVSVDTTVTIC